jgi:hypothetical protein
VPWCERCDRFLNPNTVQADGTCPGCGRSVEAPPGSASARGSGSDTEAELASVGVETDEDVKAPWHFWVMIAAAAIYLGWRLLEGVWWLIQQAL